MKAISVKESAKFAKLITDIVSDKLYRKTYLSGAGLRLDFVQHFPDRIFDRKIEFETIRDILQNVVDNHLCELIYAIHLPEQYTRIDFLRDGVMIGCTLNLHRSKLTMRTVVSGRKFEGMQKEYILHVD